MPGFHAASVSNDGLTLSVKIAGFSAPLANARVDDAKSCVFTVDGAAETLVQARLITVLETHEDVEGFPIDDETTGSGMTYVGTFIFQLLAPVTTGLATLALAAQAGFFLDDNEASVAFANEQVDNLFNGSTVPAANDAPNWAHKGWRRQVGAAAQRDMLILHIEEVEERITEDTSGGQQSVSVSNLVAYRESLERRLDELDRAVEGTLRGARPFHASFRGGR